MPIFSSLNPALKTLLPTIGLAYGLQAAAAIPSIYFQSDRFYDFSGSLTYLSCTALSLYLPSIRARYLASSQGIPKPAWPGIRDFHPRQVLVSGLTAIWAARLGSFLFARILKSGGDSRFEKIKDDPKKFAVAFFAQATWVTLVCLPVLATNAIPAHALAPLGILDYLGTSIWISGFLMEAIADRQKSKWVQDKHDKKHTEDFISKGLWAKSRHPNYAGESMLWSGMAIITGLGAGLVGGAASAFYGGSWAGGLMAVGSPAFTTFLLTKISGVPLSEKKYDKKYGGRKDYEEWKKNTPVFWPKLF